MLQKYEAGTHHFHDEPNMNYAFNRILSVNGGDLEEISGAAGRIVSIEDWLSEFGDLYKKALSEGRTRQAAAYLRAVNFYLSAGNPEKRATWEEYVRQVRSLNGEAFGGWISEERVPFGAGYLPVWHVVPEKVSGRRNVAVMHLGYDSLKEELLPIIPFFRRAGIELYLFEGPGQGEALYSGGLHMISEWEQPVGAVLDHFGLDDVTLIGLSLGGYLAPRAAAFENRISRVIAWGVMFDFFETVISRRGKLFETFLKTCLNLRLSAFLNVVTRLKMRKDTYARWGIEQGMHVYGVDSPYHYFRKLAGYTTRDISHLIRQDFLLLGNTEDHFIPEEHFCRQAAILKNVRSFTGRLFTRDEKAENHVGFGNMPLVLETMILWIRERTGEVNAV